MNRPLPVRNLTLSLLLAVGLAAPAKADSLELVNGDLYRGTVVSVTQSNVEFQSEVLGLITLQRDKVARINLGNSPAPKIPTTNTAAPPVGPSLIMEGRHTLTPATGSASGDAVLQQMRQQGVDPALVSQVQEQVFGQGNPVAAQKYDELMGGLMSGSLNVADIRAQAQESINQIKEAKQQLGPDGGGDMFDGYLAILENFVAETATNDVVTPQPASAPASTPAPAPAATAAAAAKQ